MLKIKLSRTGKKNSPHYRVVIMEEHSKLTGSALETIGHYHPQQGHEFVLDRESYAAWIKKGAKPTEKVAKLAAK